MSRHSEDSYAYRKARRAFLAEHPVCWICGHGGANQIDHRIPRSRRPVGRLEMWNWEPSHGPRPDGSPGCAVCATNCNQKRGTGGAPAPALWVTSPHW